VIGQAIRRFGPCSAAHALGLEVVEVEALCAELVAVRMIETSAEAVGRGGGIAAQESAAQASRRLGRNYSGGLCCTVMPERQLGGVELPSKARRQSLTDFSASPTRTW
jgi:hypothetical protein